MVSLRRNPEQAGAAGLEGDDARLEVADRAVLHGHPPATFEGNPDVAKISVGIAAGIGGPVSVDRVAVQVERDVVRPDEDADFGAVDEVLMELRVGGDRVAAAHVGCMRWAAAEAHDGSRREGQDRNRNAYRWRAMETNRDRHCYPPCLAADGSRGGQATLHRPLDHNNMPAHA